jgi:hypothetical protein
MPYGSVQKRPPARDGGWDVIPAVFSGGTDADGKWWQDRELLVVRSTRHGDKLLCSDLCCFMPDTLVLEDMFVRCFTRWETFMHVNFLSSG